jgi:prepilin-type N-terminal cleavage/methylation domain-containing protein
MYASRIVTALERRRGATLLELILVVAIAGILLALVLPAISKVREAAAMASSRNNLRQISLGLQHYAADRGGRMPGVINPKKNRYPLYFVGPMLPDECRPIGDILSYIDGEPSIQFVPVTSINTTGWSEKDWEDYYYALTPHRKTLLSPGDPTIPSLGRMDAPSSYAANLVAFTGPPRIDASFPDGLSNTVAYAERYARSWNIDADRSALPCIMNYDAGSPGIGERNGSWAMNGPRRATFADAGWLNDVVPVSSNGTTAPSQAGMTFQLRPTPSEALSIIPQTPFSGGLLVAFFDGSVRVVRHGVAENVFWSATTPAGGEVIGTLD